MSLHLLHFAKSSESDKFDEVQETFEKFATDEAMLNLRVDLSEEQIDEERQRYKSSLMPIAIWCFLIFDN